MKFKIDNVALEYLKKQKVGKKIRLHHKPLNEGEWKEVNFYKETFEVFVYFLAFLYLREHSIQFFNW